MTRLSGPGLSVLRGFIAASNEQYRKAGLGEYQMRVDRNGRVTQPHRPAPSFRPVPGTGKAAADQAAQGAAQQPAAAGATQQPSAGAAQSPAGAPSSGAAQPGAAGPSPTLTSVKPTADGFSMTWQPVQGARQYGIWVDGALVGHVPKPSFAGTLAPGGGGAIQVDAVLADGSRTEPTTPLALVRDAQGKLAVRDPRNGTAPAPTPAASATAPAAPAS